MRPLPQLLKSPGTQETGCPGPPACQHVPGVNHASAPNTPPGSNPQPAATLGLFKTRLDFPEMPPPAYPLIPKRPCGAAAPARLDCVMPGARAMEPHRAAPYGLATTSTRPWLARGDLCMGQALYCSPCVPQVFAHLQEPCSEDSSISPFTHKAAELWATPPAARLEAGSSSRDRERMAPSWPTASHCPGGTSPRRRGGAPSVPTPIPLLWLSLKGRSGRSVCACRFTGNCVCVWGGYPAYWASPPHRQGFLTASHRQGQPVHQGQGLGASSALSLSQPPQLSGPRSPH